MANILQFRTKKSTFSFCRVAFKFGVISMISGLLGVPIGGYLAQKLRSKFSNVDPQICAVGLLMSSPMVYLALVTASATVAMCYMSVFFGELLLNLNWSIVGDILLVRNV